MHEDPKETTPLAEDEISIDAGEPYWGSATSDDSTSSAKESLEATILREPTTAKKPLKTGVAPWNLSPLLANLPLHKRPNHQDPDVETACETCPRATWFMTPDSLKCWCHSLSVLTWETLRHGRITQCDSRERAIAEILASRQR